MQQDFHLLPENIAHIIEAYAQETFLNTAPVRVCVGGTFSVGKSSLLNMLLQKNILPSALEECTTLPTFLEYGAQEQFTLTAHGDTAEISEEQFQNAILNAPDGGQFVTLALAQDWLKNIEILDLPGLGSMSQSNKDYSRLQLEHTDIVLYLLAPRGPSQEDMDTLSMLHSYGKTVFLGAGRWDEVEASARKGEALPDIKKWQETIAYKTGIEATIMPVSMYGEGRESILSFLQHARQEILQIRKKRFVALAMPVLQHAHKENEAALEVLTIDSESVIQEKHVALMEEKNALLVLKEKLLQEKAVEHTKVMDTFSEKVQELQSSLKRTLQQHKKTLVDAHELDGYVLQGEKELRQSLGDMAQYASFLSEKYGQSFACPEFEQLHIQVPQVEPVAVTNFIDAGRVEFLRKQLHTVHEQLQHTSHADSPETQEKLAALQQILVHLQSEHTGVMGLSLPKVEIENPSRGKGATVGRVVGEVADFALIWLLPNLVAAKAASTATKAASVASKASKTAQIAKGVARAAQKLHNTAVTGERAEQLPSIADKLQILDKFTIGYWGEQVGRMMEGDTSSQWVTDPELLQKQQESLRAIEAELQSKRQELYNLEDAVCYSQEQKKQFQAEKLSLEKELKEMEQNALEQQKILEESNTEQEKKNIAYAAEKSANHWQSSFNAQSRAMSEMLASSMKKWWDAHIEAALTQHLHVIEELSAFLALAPQERQAQEQAILKQREAITTVIKSISSPV